LTADKSHHQSFSTVRKLEKVKTSSTLNIALLQMEIGRRPGWTGVATEIQRRGHAMGNNKHQKDVKFETESQKPAANMKGLDSTTSAHQEGFMDRIHMPQFHRPSKEELLAAATGFWSRLRVRFKWSTIRSVRPFNLDEITGFISWILLGHVLWIVIGTTTFVSLAILAINTVFAQETLAGWIGNYLTKSSGLKVVFESAIVPTWGDGVITFKNVFVSRRPGHNTKSGVVKGDVEAAAIAAALSDEIPAEEQNYTQFDITLGEVNVTLSFTKWWNSKGLLQNVEVKHVRGVVDRTHVFWTGEQVDPKSYRHIHVPGDFEIDSFKIEDLLVTVHQPNGFRPFPVSIYSADLPRLRKQWVFYDLLSANNMTGEYDRSLFTIHPRQIHSYTGAQLNDSDAEANEPWKKQSRIRIDGLNIDHLNRGIEGPFSWIHEGNVDIIADIMIPNDNDESVMKVIGDFYDRMEATLTSEHHRASRDCYVEEQESARAQAERQNQSEDDKRFLVMDLRVHLNDVRAVVPIFTRDLSYVNNALIRPIVAYINSRRTFIPINCRVVKRASDFDGSWTVFDSGLMDDLSAEVYDAFERDVTDEQARLRRFKKVGLWSLQLAVQAIFMGEFDSAFSY
jgi:mitochondrial distribution and morphology protein 31